MTQYTIIRFLREHEDGTETVRNQTLDWVSAHAQQLIRSGAAERAQVHEASGQLVLNLPRLARRAGRARVK